LDLEIDFKRENSKEILEKEIEQLQEDIQFKKLNISINKNVKEIDLEVLEIV
jgi:hypothetical protein